MHASPGSCPDLLQNSPSATEHLFIFRFKQQQRAASWDKELPSAPMPGISSSPLAHFTGIHLPSCSAGIQSKISAQSLARISFSLAGLWKFQQRKHVNITSSKTPHKWELEEWKSELLLMMTMLTWVNLFFWSVPAHLTVNAAQPCLFYFIYFSCLRPPKPDLMTCAAGTRDSSRTDGI